MNDCTMICPSCGSEDTYFSKKRKCYICEDCDHKFGEIIEENKKQLTFFISYGHDENKIIPICVAKELEKRGHKVWIDKNDIKAGEDWRASILNGIMSSDEVIAFLSMYSTRKPGVCLDELAIALAFKGGNILPVILENEEVVDFPGNIQEKQYLDMSKWKDHYGPSGLDEWFERKLRELIETVENDKNARFAGEIETLYEILKPNSLNSKVRNLNIESFIGRKWLIDEYTRWVDEKTNREFIIKGLPGIGKSRFMAHICHYKSWNVLASIFFEWNKYENFSERNIVLSLIFQTATKMSDYREILLKIILQDDMYLLSPDELLEKYYLTPLTTMIDGNRDKYVLIFDALDEAPNVRETIKLIRKIRDNTPHWITIAMTSRDIEEVGTFFHSNGVIIDNNSERVYDDIRQFILSMISDCPSNTLEEIVQRSQGVFLYAVMVCKGIEKSEIDKNDVSQLPHSLFDIYSDYLYRICENPYEYRKKWRDALAVLIALKDPMPESVFMSILDWQEEKMFEFLYLFDSYLEVSKGEERTIKLFHKSFEDWISNRDYAGLFYADRTIGYDLISRYCYEIYKKNYIKMPVSFQDSCFEYLRKSNLKNEYDEMSNDRDFMCWLGRNNNNRSRFSVAIHYAEEVIKKSKQIRDTPYIEARSLLCEIYIDIGEKRKAYNLALDILKEIKKEKGIYHPKSIIKAYENAGWTEKDEGSIDDARRYFEYALDVYRSYEDRKMYSHTLYLYSVVLYKFPEESEKCKKCLAESSNIIQEIYGFESNEMTLNINMLGWIANRENRIDEMIELFNQARLIREKIYGKTNPRTAKAYDNLSVAYTKKYIKTGDKNCLYEAVMYVKDAIEANEKSFGRNNVEVARNKCHLADIHCLLDRVSDAIDEYDNAKKIYESYGTQYIKEYDNVCIKIDKLREQ